MPSIDELKQMQSLPLKLKIKKNRTKSYRVV